MWLISGSIVLITILALFYGYSTGSDLGFYSFGESIDGKVSQSLPISDVLLCALSMLVGIAFGVIHEQLKGEEGQINILRKSMAAFNSAVFFRALLAAPIIFSVIYIAALKQPDPVIALIFAFENGFFCNAILRQRIDEK